MILLSIIIDFLYVFIFIFIIALRGEFSIDWLEVDCAVLY